MARGNQRDKAREKNLKDAANTKKKNGVKLSGTEFARQQENVAAIMRKKQEEANKKKEAEAAGAAIKK